MADKRSKDANWILQPNKDGTLSRDQIPIALLMDLRDELKKLNTLLHCQNFIDIPRKLERVARNTAAAKKKRR